MKIAAVQIVKKLLRLILLPGFALVLPALASSSQLFESGETVDVVFEAPMRDLSSRRKDNPEFPGTFRYTDTAGNEHALPVIVSTRGHSRLEICDYPPLRITFDRESAKGSLFEGQRKLKLVTQCMGGKGARDWLFLELAIYRAYNVITDYSFRVRQLNVTYHDSESRSGRERTHPAFFLEDDKDMAKRLGRKRIRPPEVEPSQMSVAESAHHLLFQYLIGNTDFAVRRGPRGEGCCHNARVLTEAGRQQDWVVVPYDFDYSGIINAKYAAVSKRLPISRVTTRLYRGFCMHNEQLMNSVTMFNAKRAEIEAALLPPEVSRSKQRRVRNYVERFYRTINDPQEFEENLLEKCRGGNSMPVRESEVSPGYARTP